MNCLNKCKVIQSRELCAYCNKRDHKIYLKSYVKRNKNNSLQHIFANKKGQYWNGRYCPTCNLTKQKKTSKKYRQAIRFKDSKLRKIGLSAERQAIVEELKKTNGNQFKAARNLGISRPVMHEKIKQLNIRFKTRKVNVTVVKELVCGVQQ